MSSEQQENDGTTKPTYSVGSSSEVFQSYELGQPVLDLPVDGYLAL